MKEALSVEAYRHFVNYSEHVHATGGQELIMAEVVAALYPCLSVEIPFGEACGSLIDELQSRNISAFVRAAGEFTGSMEAVYFGTPTIVDGEPLFQHSGTAGWDVQRERAWVRLCVAQCIASGNVQTIVCGLGSGDITPAQRIEDLGGGRVVAYKHFGEFEDWVIKREL